MSIIALRDTLRPQLALWRRLLVGLAAVATIVAGLLAMHSLNIASHHNEVALAQHDEAVVTQPEGTTGHHDSASANVVSAADGIGTCDGACGMNQMLGACILALLVATLLFAGAATVSRMSNLLLAMTTYKSVRGTLAMPAPPSLHVLSISRT